jgi:hypothetical protein
LGSHFFGSIHFILPSTITMTTMMKATVRTTLVLLTFTSIQLSVLGFLASPTLRDHHIVTQKRNVWKRSLSLSSTPSATGSWSGGTYDPTTAVVPEGQESPPKEAASTSLNTNAEKASRLKQDLLALAAQTKRGFKATSKERKQARDLIFQLGDLNPTAEPARAYYSNSNGNNGSTAPGLTGKWTLMYTDAPDITSLDSGANSLATLGRIGQECKPPTIKNVIEWKRPTWAANLPFSGTDDSRVLQKVVTEATASPDKPTIVDLKLAGFEVSTTDSDNEEGGDLSIPQAIQNKGLIAGLLQSRPINVQGPLKAPFGQFEVLYLDDELRIIQTGQNFLAVNLRMSSDNEWF